MNHAMRSPWKWALLVSLGLIAVAYVTAGLARLAWDIGSSYPIDLRLRWIEERFVWQGVNPQEAGHPDPVLEQSHKEMMNLGGSYPPWAYSIGLLLVPPLPWQATRWYAVAINAASLCMVGWWAYRKVAQHGNSWGWISVASALAVFPVAICVSYGQYAVIILGCLAAADQLLERRTPRGDVLAGIALGVACVKPQLGGLFVLAVLLEGRLRCFLAFSVFLAAANGLTWLLTGLDPVSMFLRSLEEASHFSFLSHNPMVALVKRVTGFHSATTILGLAGVGACLVSLGITRSHPRFLRWGVCAVITMFWAYRRHYDVPLLVIPLIGLLSIALNRQKMIWWLAHIVFGLSLWLPIRHGQWTLPVVQWMHFTIWMVGAGILLGWRGVRASEREGHPSVN